MSHEERLRAERIAREERYAARSRAPRPHQAKWAGKCIVCGCRWQAGDVIMIDSGPHGMTRCLDCGLDAAMGQAR